MTRIGLGVRFQGDERIFYVRFSCCPSNIRLHARRTINNKQELSDYIVTFDHEGGKGLLSHKDKIAVFDRRTGDSIFSKSTMSLGEFSPGSLPSYCKALGCSRRRIQTRN